MIPLEEVSDDGDEDFTEQPHQQAQLRLNIVRDIDEACEVDVTLIIRSDFELDWDEEDLMWTDDEEDPLVENILRLVNDIFKFKNGMFVGGNNSADLVGKKKGRRGSKKVPLRASKGKAKIRQSSFCMTYHSGSGTSG